MESLPMTDQAAPTGAAPEGGPPSPLSLTQTHLSWMRTRLSVERTFMSWTRTAVSLIGFGFTIYQFLGRLDLAAQRPDAPRNFGIAFIVIGLVAMTVGMAQRHAEVAYLNGAGYEEVGWQPGLPRWRWSNLIAAVVIAIGVVTIGWIVLSG
jgi:putative membrane protein